MRNAIIFVVLATFLSAHTTVSAQSAPTISSVTDNRTIYSNSQIPRYEKLEVTFQVNNVQATNLQFPYLSAAQAGTYLGRYVDMGISVDGLFLPPGETDWNKAFRQPAFYYQDFETGANQAYLYPTDNFSWKVRFSPNMIGEWKYKLEARDKGGVAQSAETAFVVTSSTNKGFIRVSEQDGRYFEFEDGSLFTGLGYNLDMSALSSDANLQKLKDSNLNFIRAWISPMNIHGSAWDAWEMMPNHYDGYLPRVPLLLYETSPGQREFRWYLSEGNSWYEECAFLGHTQPATSLKRNTNYFIRAKYKGSSIAGPRDSAFPNYGFVIKIGGWQDTCRDPYKSGVDPSFSRTVPVTTYGTDNTNWNTVVGTWNSGSSDTLPNFYMALENASTGSNVYVESIEMIEMTGGTVDNPTLVGPNILDKPSPLEHLYFSQKPSYQLDRIIEKIPDYDVYVRPVVNEKQEYIFSDLLPDGNFQQPDDQNRFYGSGRNEYAIRFIQKAWWRYIQARWGYSPNIHSWELVNEGDPGNSNHYILTDELGKFMKCGVFGIPVGTGNAQTCVSNHPNKHMASTSLWHSFMPSQFWDNTNYPNVDFADVHAYISTTNGTAVDLNDPGCSKVDMEKDAVAYHLCHSVEMGGWQIGKPIIRGEAGMDGANTQSNTILGINRDTTGVWYHGYLWSSLNHGALYESYWWTNHIYGGSYDHRPYAKVFGDFLKTIPLNNGHYVNAAPTVTNTSGTLQAIGQKDVTNGNAHIWVRNKNHTWKNVVDSPGSVGSATGTVAISGFANDKQYTLETWNTYTGTKTTGSITSSGTGAITLPLTNLTTDTAFKIINPTAPTTTPTPTTPTFKPGDVDGNGSVNLVDLSTLLANFGKSGAEIGRGNGDLDGNQSVNLVDLSQLLANFGT